jgi:hypothetical protein
MDDGTEVPDSRPLISRMRDLVRGEGARTTPSGRHAVRPVQVANMSDITLFASVTDEVLPPPDGLEPWDPPEGEEIPWELREDDSPA